MADDDEEFAYFLPRGIEDFDADENLAAYERDQLRPLNQQTRQANTAGTGTHHERRESDEPTNAAQQAANTGTPTAAAAAQQATAPSSGGSSGSYSGGQYAPRVPPLTASWQASATQPVYTSAAQHAALRSVLEQTQRARLQQQQGGGYGAGTSTPSSTDAILAAYYAQTSNSLSNSNSYYPTPTASPSNAGSSISVGVSGGSSGSSSATPGASPSPDPNNSITQMQFYQQLQLYQQAMLLQQQQQQQAMGGGGAVTSAPSHYTAVPASYTKTLPGMNIVADEPPREEQTADAAAVTRTVNAGPQAAGARRRPLPHNAHAQHSAINNTRTVEPAPAAAPVTAPAALPPPPVQQPSPKPAAVAAGVAPAPAILAAPTSAPAAAGSWASGNSTVLAGSGTLQAHAAPFDSHAKSGSTKSIPVSVIAGTKKENWPKVATVTAAAVVAAAAPPTAAAAPKKTEAQDRHAAKQSKEEARKAAQAAAAAAKAASSAAASSTKGRQATAPAVRPPPAVTIRHIESDEPVPLTAVELSTLPAHHRKNEGKIIPAIPAPTNLPAAQPLATAPATAVTSVPSVPKAHHKFVIPGPSVLQSDNEFDLLADADPDAQSLLDSSSSKADRKKVKKGKRATDPEPEPEEEEVSEETAEQEEEATEAPQEEETEAAEETEEAQHEAAAAEEDEEGEVAEDEEAEEEDTEPAAVSSSSDSDSDAAAAPSALSVSSPSRTPSPSMAVSPTTGLPVPPILRNPSAPANHTRRVSFYAPPTKKQLAAQRAREQPWLANQSWKEQQEKQAAGQSASTTTAASSSSFSATDASGISPPELPERASSVSYPVESVSGLKKRGGGKKKAAKVAPPPKPPEEESESDSEDDSPAASTPIVPSSKPKAAASSLVQHVLTLWAGLSLQYGALRSKSSLQSLMGVGSYLAGVLFGLLWSLLCVVARVHRHAASVLSGDHHLAFCFSFLYLFPYLVSHMTWWAPPWAAPCLWYAFLMQVFCTQGAAWMVAGARVLLPLLFLTEGVSHHALLLELNGGERILAASALAAFKTQEYSRPLFLAVLALQTLSSLLYGQHVAVQWTLLIASLLVIHEQEISPLPMISSSASKGASASAASAKSKGVASSAGGPSSALSAGSDVSPLQDGGASSSGLLGALGAFNRRTRAKAVAQKARRTGRF